MHGILGNSQAMRFWSTLPHETIEQSREWLRSMIEAPPDESDDFIVTLEGRVVGKLGAWRLPEIGYLFDPSVWGRGYAFEALTGFIAHRRRGGGTELTADTDPANLASRRLLLRAGFEETGHAARTYRIGGVWHDSVYYRLAL